MGVPNTAIRSDNKQIDAIYKFVLVNRFLSFIMNTNRTEPLVNNDPKFPRSNKTPEL